MKILILFFSLAWVCVMSESRHENFSQKNSVVPHAQMLPMSA